MDWATIKEAVRTAMETASGVADVFYQGEDEAAAFHAGDFLELRLRAPGALGIDEYRHEWDGAEVDFTIHGVRRFTIQVMAETMDQSVGETAPGQLLSDLRTRLRRPSILTALRAAEVAISEIRDVVEADYQSDGRRVSSASMEVVFNASEVDADTAADGNGWIETVQLESDTLNDPGGTPLDPDQQVDTTVGG